VHAGQTSAYRPWFPRAATVSPGFEDGAEVVVVQEVEDEPLHVERVAALDVGKGMVEVCIRVPSDGDRRRRAQEVRTFGTTKKEIVALADWLRCWGVNTVVMESIGDYWKAPFFRLEAEGFACELLDAKQVKALPGRPKTDRCDAVWLAKITERGMGAGSCFVPSEEIRRLRTLTRYRRHLIEERSREKQRSEKLLEDAMIKLSVVVSDLHGVSARDIMEALIGGQRDPKVLAQLARGKMRNAWVTASPSNPSTPAERPPDTDSTSNRRAKSRSQRRSRR
jgi:transposase